ncbi:MAG: TonB-dependent receptor [Bryobacterales bacterium]|nr:TonB-dependent receptor [Bryobacterales bacterium]
MCIRDGEALLLGATVLPTAARFAHYYLSENTLAEDELAYGSNIAGWTGRTRDPRAQNAGLNHVWTTSPTTLNQLTLGFTRSFSFDTPLVTREPSALGLAGMLTYTNGGSPTPGGRTLQSQFRRAREIRFEHLSDPKQLQLDQRRAHLQVWRRDDESLVLPNRPAAFSFNGQRTGGGVASRGDSFADFLLGGYQQLSVTNGVRDNDGDGAFYALYAQDDWKVTSRLTLNLGLRYELPIPWRDKFDRINTVYPDPSVQSTRFPSAPVGMLFPGDLPRGLYNTDKNNFAPRVGFAWDVFGDGRTAIRGAYGLFYDTLNTDSIAQENQPFFGGSRAFSNGSLSNPFGSVGATAPPAVIDPNAFTFTFPINGLFSAQNRDFRSTYVNSWNFSIQRQLGRSWMVSGAYIGKSTIKLMAYRPFNAAPFVPGNDAQGRPLSTEGNAESRVPFGRGIYGPQGYYLDNSFTANYNSAQFEVNKQFSSGLQLSGNYTFAKALDSSSTISLGGCLANPFDARASKGRSDFDRRHSVVASAIYTPPVFKEEKGFLGRVFGGWSISGITTLQSGTPVTATTNQNTALDGTTCQSAYHPDIVGEIARDHASKDDMLAQFFNRSAFALPSLGRYGTAARNMFSGPGLVSVDSALLKDINVSETMRFQLRGEFTNLFNRANFNNPIGQLANPRYGQITGAGPGRAVQLGLKFLW